MVKIMPIAPFIAVDIGNSQLKFGLFSDNRSENGLPVPTAVFEPPATSFNPASLCEWLAGAGRRVDEPMRWWIASVNRGPTQALAAWLSERGAQEGKAQSNETGLAPHYCFLKHSDLPLKVSLDEPQRVGIDRLLGAVAANRLRSAGRAAIVIDVGSAITVDLISSAGAFLGGAILPGIGMSARAMHEFTDLLPLLAMDELAEPPPALGASTHAAMQSGLFWGAIGAMKELLARLADREGRQAGGKMSPVVYLTGGAAPSVAKFVDPGATFVPHLVLGGIALLAEQ
jgi:type III pantothenate kinase